VSDLPQRGDYVHSEEASWSKSSDGDMTHAM
jgi:hypothetical protein